MFKRIAALALIAVLGIAAPAAAQSFQGNNFIQPSSDNVVAECFTPGSTVTFVFTLSNGTTQSVSAVAGDDFSASAPRPANAVGVSVTGTDCVRGVQFTQTAVLTPVQAGGATAGAPLPRTGDDTSLDLGRIGLFLVAAGGVTVFMARRRQLAHAGAERD
jgi:hypothetical protein